MKRAALIAAILLLAVGAGGFVPALTPGGRFLGLFATDAMHNTIAIGAGVLGLAMSVNRASARLYFRALGLLFGLFAVMGFLAGRDGPVLGMAMNRPDDVLNLVVAALSLWLGFGWDRADARLPAQA